MTNAGDIPKALPLFLDTHGGLASEAALALVAAIALVRDHLRQVRQLDVRTVPVGDRTQSVTAKPRAPAALDNNENVIGDQMKQTQRCAIRGHAGSVEQERR